METIVKSVFENIQQEIAKELQNSRHTIHLAVAWFTDPELYTILCEKAKQGLVVILFTISDDINLLKSQIDFEKLKKAGGHVYLVETKDEKMHHKFCVIDNKTVITGSYNWTHKAKVNDENIVILKNNAGCVNQFMMQFYELFRKYVKDINKLNADMLEEQSKIDYAELNYRDEDVICTVGEFLTACHVYDSVNIVDESLEDYIGTKYYGPPLMIYFSPTNVKNKEHSWQMKISKSLEDAIANGAIDEKQLWDRETIEKHDQKCLIVKGITPKGVEYWYIVPPKE